MLQGSARSWPLHLARSSVLCLTPALLGHPVILYDGVCGLCNRWVQFLLRRDQRDRFRFAPLQSALAAQILMRHSVTPGSLDTVYVVQQLGQPEECLLAQST